MWSFKLLLTIAIVQSLLIANASGTKKEVKRSYNILGVFLFPSQSHHILGSTLLKELARRGHNVTMISPFPFDEKIPNYTDIELEGLMEFKEKHMQQRMQGTSGTMNFLAMFKTLYGFVAKIGNIILRQESMQDFLKSDSQFDVLIMFHPLTEFLFPLSHKFDAPIILFAPSGATNFLNKITGNISPYSYVPHLLSSFSDEMTFFQRLKNTLIGLIANAAYAMIIKPQYEQLIDEYFPDSPPLDELYDNVALAFVNGHFSTTSPRPLTPNMIEIGGFHVESVDPLPKDLQTYLDEAEDGVVYFSFGTNIKISDMPAEKLQIIVKCLAKLKQRVLWKFEGQLDDLPKNIRIEKWLPQKSILVHPNVKAFITHGGKGSIVEATKTGVPMLAIPFFGDQPQNVAEAVNRKYAVRLLFDDVNEENFSEALNEILNNPIYVESIKRKSALMAAKPMKAMDTAMYWIDHVVQHKGADHLKPASIKLNVFQELCLDVYAFLAGALLVFIFAIYLLCKGICKLCRCCMRRKPQQKDKVKKS